MGRTSMEPSKKRLRPADALVTKRVRALIDLAHEGNLREASIASEMPYATLRDLYTGKTTNPSVDTLERLGRAYNFYGGWFTNPNEKDEVPSGGLIVELREVIQTRPFVAHREVLIPMAAWPLPWVLGKGMLILEELPPSPSRPILGEVTEDREINFLINETVLHPLLVAEREGMIPRLGSHMEHVLAPDIRRVHIPLMRHVGGFWQSVLQGLQPEQR